MKKLFTLKLLLCTMLCMVCGQSWATPVSISGGNGSLWEYDSSTHTLTISGSGIIPDFDYYNGKNKRPSPWDGYLSEIEILYIGSDITSIGDFSFRNCINLRSATIKGAVTKIGAYAFQSCTSLKTISFLYGLSSIKGCAFWGCTNLESISLPNSVSTILNSVFYNCSSLKSFIVPSGVIELDTDTFCGCTSLEWISIPEGLTKFSNFTFKNCVSLKSITLPSSLVNLGYQSFEGCSNITDIYCNASSSKLAYWNNDNNSFMPSKGTIFHVNDEAAWKSKYSGANVTFVGDLANVNLLKGTVDDENGTAVLHVSSEDRPSISGAIVVPTTYNSENGNYTVTGIGTNAFKDCSGLTSVFIPRNVTTIGDNAFYNCNNLLSVEYADGSLLNTIGSYSFYNCTSLASLTIPNNVTSIGSGSFDGCNSLTSVVFPSGLATLAGGAFQNCGELVSATFDNCVPTISSGLFNNCPKLTDIYYPACAYSLYNNCGFPDGITLHPQIKIDREWTTYCASASFDVPEGIDAYVVKSYNADAVTLKKVSTINEGEGLLMRPAVVGATYDATLCAVTPTAYESNLMKGVTEDTYISRTDGDYTNYIFTKKNSNLGFYLTNAGTFPAYKAYLQLPTASVAASKLLTLDFEDETSAINDVAPMKRQEDNKFFNLSGQRVTQATRGLYIVNGKKMVVK